MSNFSEAKVTLNGNTFSSAEAAYHAAKYADKPEIVKKFTTLTADEAYKLADTIPYDVKAFAKKRIPLMRQILASKYSDPNLKRKLLDTKPKILAEYNWWGNKFWGISPDGENWLGRLLMELRDKL